MTAEEILKEVKKWHEDACIAASCDPKDCKHSFDDRPCQVQYIRALGKILKGERKRFDCFDE